MLKYSLQFAVLFSVEYLVFMFLCFGLFAFPSRIKEGFQMQLVLIAGAGIVLVATAFIGG